MISSLNYIEQLVENVMAEQLSQFSQSYQKLHMGQMRAKNSRYMVDEIAIMVNSIHKT